MTDSHDAYGLLISHAQAWATKTKRTLDPSLLSIALNLRDHQDRVPGTSWPAGSAEHLMVVRWPGHGPAGVPDVDALVATLDTYWRFLRASGRLSSDSAEPAALLTEAKRAKSRMREQCAEPTAFGANKVLFGFGKEIGIELENLDSVELLQSRLGQVVEAWNALPEEERRTRMPGPPGAGSVVSRDFDAAVRGSSHALGDGAFAHQPDPSVAELVPAQDPADVAADARRSGFVRAVERLVEWIGPSGKPATAAGYLKPVVARQAVDDLGLDEWTRHVYGYTPTAWRSAGDHPGLGRLYSGALFLGLMEIRGSKVLACATFPHAGEDCARAAVTLLMCEHMEDVAVNGPSPLLDALLGLGVHEARTRKDLERRWSTSHANPLSRLAGLEDHTYTSTNAQAVDTMLRRWEDTNVWRDRPGTRGELELTSLGLELLRALLADSASNLGRMSVEDALEEAFAHLLDGDEEAALDYVEIAVYDAEPDSELDPSYPAPECARGMLWDELMSSIPVDRSADRRWVDQVLSVLRSYEGEVRTSFSWMLRAIASGDYDLSISPTAAAKLTRSLGRDARISADFGLSTDPLPVVVVATTWVYVESAVRLHHAFCSHRH